MSARRPGGAYTTPSIWNKVMTVFDIPKTSHISVKDSVGSNSSWYFDNSYNRMRV